MDAALDIDRGRVGYSTMICDSDEQVMAVDVEYKSDGQAMIVGVGQGVFSDHVDSAQVKTLPFGYDLVVRRCWLLSHIQCGLFNLFSIYVIHLRWDQPRWIT